MNSIPLKNIKLQRLIRHKSSRTCAYCGRIGPLEVDRILPRSKGGSSSILNLQFVCRSCNAMKGSKLNWKTPTGGEKYRI